ncbi:MAG: hypothetical protein KJP00_11860 [Bacteroidia bacterium]|nr:hypothetical protein [Bacteroidia bacterium]
MKYLFIVFLLGSITLSVSCQDTIAQPTWDDIEWISGDWIGDGFGGTSYEHWSKPIADIMTGTYRHVSDGKNNFFEFFTISKRQDGSFVLMLRHFNPDMNAWEDKEGQLVWEFNGKTDDSITFGPCTYKRVGEDKMEIELIMQRNGKKDTEIFNFKRI